MASTSIFAPQVKSVQPAFVYDSGDKTGKVKIYFSFSSYNSENDIQGIFYTLVDPNLASTWGDNSMINGNFKYKYVSSFDEENGQYFFEIDFNPTAFKELTKNQYYQMQLYFVDKNRSGIVEETQNWFNTNQQYISEPSQVTLIRPIDPVTFTFDLPEPVDGEYSVYNFTGLKGSINSDIETLESCYCSYGGEENAIYFELGVIDYFYPTNNFQGKQFNIPIPAFAENTVGDIVFHYTTIHGYYGEETLNIHHLPPEGNGPNLILNTVSSEMGEISFKVENVNSNKPLIIQRTSSLTQPGDWQNLVIEKPIGGGNDWYADATVESGVTYTYRALQENVSGQFCSSSTGAEASVNFDSILLSNPDYLIPIRFNPNISNFKYVTQESIINTLGGKYPVIRKNGDTKYRQFTLSGSLHIDLSANNFFVPTSDETEPMLEIYPDISNFDNIDLLLNEDFLNYEWNFYIGVNPSVVISLLGGYLISIRLLSEKVGHITNKSKLESKFRDLVIDFLYDRAVAARTRPRQPCRHSDKRSCIQRNG